MAPPLINSAGSSARPTIRASPAVSSTQTRVPAARPKRTATVSSATAVAAAPVFNAERTPSPALQLLEAVPVQLPLKQAAPQLVVTELTTNDYSTDVVAAVEVTPQPVVETEVVSNNIVCAPVIPAETSISSKALDASAAPWVPTSYSASVASADEVAVHNSSESLAFPTPAASVSAAASADDEEQHTVSTLAVRPAMSIVSFDTSATHNRRTGEHNSVVIKEDSMVKNAAGAISKVLDRILCMFVTALKSLDTHEALNRAVKAMAVARKYVKDANPDMELTFLPLNRRDHNDLVDPQLFGFTVYKTTVSETLLDHDETDLNISRGSDPKAIANAIIRITLERGQVVMKAGGADAMFVAMSAVINARRRLKRKHELDVMMVPAWITEDTVSTLGRESKFLRFNIIKCSPNGPIEQSTVHPSQGYEGCHSSNASAYAFA